MSHSNRLPVHLKRLRQGLLPCLLITLALTLQACSAAMPRVELRGEQFTVEIADDDASRARGLMFRDSMAENHGMLFIFPDEAPRAFWMKNTRIPLDILYFDRNLRLVSLQERVPPCGNAPRCPSYPSTGPARFVLELNAGTARRLGVQSGDELRLIGVP